MSAELTPKLPPKLPRRKSTSKIIPQYRLDDATGSQLASPAEYDRPPSAKENTPVRYRSSPNILSYREQELPPAQHPLRRSPEKHVPLPVNDGGGAESNEPHIWGKPRPKLPEPEPQPPPINPLRYPLSRVQGSEIHASLPRLQACSERAAERTRDALHKFMPLYFHPYPSRRFATTSPRRGGIRGLPSRLSEMHFFDQKTHTSESTTTHKRIKIHYAALPEGGRSP